MNSRQLADMLRAWSTRLRTTNTPAATVIHNVTHEMDEIAAQLDKAPKRSLD